MSGTSNTDLTTCLCTPARRGVLVFEDGEILRAGKIESHGWELVVHFGDCPIPNIMAESTKPYTLIVPAR